MSSKLKKAILRTRIGGGFYERSDLIKGFCTYYTKPSRREALSNAFNCQDGRQAIFRAIIQAVDFQVILETGTYLGLTTEFMHHESGLPVSTTESSPEYYSYAKQRFKAIPGITGHYSDSRDFLRSTLDELPSKDQPVFLYLDAHWNKDLPLLEEVQIVLERHPNSVMLIDDFKVPSDPGYEYDDYGDGNTLHIEYFDPIADLGFRAFFPSLPSEHETGAKRGCVVLVKDPDLIETMRSLDVLREHTTEPVAV